MQAAHHRMNGRLGEQAADLRADIDDAGMRAGTEDDQPEVAHVHDQHALVHQVGVGPPLLLVVQSAKMVLASGLERRDPGNLAAVVEMAVEQGALPAVIDDAGATRLHLRGRGHACGGKDLSVRQQHAAFVEHAGIDVDADAVAAAPGDDRVECRRQRSHVIPVPMGHDDLLDASEIDREVPAVAHEGCALGAGVEEQDMLGGAEAGPEPQAIAEIGNEQGLAGDLACARQHDICEFRYGEGRLARVRVAHIVGDDVDRQRIDGGEGRSRHLACDTRHLK